MQMSTRASIQAVISFALTALYLYRMVRVSPQSRSRLQWRPLGRKWIPIGFLSLYLVGIRLPLIPFGDLTFDKVLDVTIFVAGVGLFEESLCRGWLFARFERINQRAALIGSSLIFGLLHLINLASGVQNRYVFAQVFVAMTMGYLFAALMLYTGTIWVGVVLHALMDLPPILKGNVDQLLIGSNGEIFSGILVVCGVNIIIGILFLKASKKIQAELPVAIEAHSAL